MFDMPLPPDPEDLAAKLDLAMQRIADLERAVIKITPSALLPNALLKGLGSG